LDFDGERTVNDISDASIMNALGRQMTTAVAKQMVAAGNLANIDTPGYRTRTATFDDMLEQQLQMKPTAAGKAAAPAAAGSVVGAAEVDGLPLRRDGNNVQLDRELLDMTKASADFSAAQAALAAKFRLIRYAINEGR
jgi:flagellar basal-body rod protein FlgB